MNLRTASLAKRPPLALALTELPRAGLEAGLFAALLPLLALAPRGSGQPVVVLPGFLASDLSTAPLRQYLEFLGYQVHAWELGRNLGPRTIGQNGMKLLERLDRIHAETGEKVSVIGWSLGGVMARQLSRLRADKIRQVITLGSPITGGVYDNNVWPLFKPLTGQGPGSPATRKQFRESRSSPPVPSTAIYSEEDGVVTGRHCQEVAGKHAESIRVYGSHVGLGVNPMALLAMADRLAQKPGSWASFASQGNWRAWLYPSPADHR